MNFIYTVHITSVGAWFVHLGNHFSSSWVYGWISFYITKNRVKWILHAHQVELAYEWRSFWLSFYSLFKLRDDHVCALSKNFPSNISSMHWIVVLVWFVHGFGRIFFKLHPVLCFRRIYLRFIIHLSFLSRKAYGRYILASKDFIRPCLLASHGSFWMNVQKWRIPIQLCIYLKIHHIYIYIYLKIQTYANIRPQAWHMLKS